MIEIEQAKPHEVEFGLMTANNNNREKTYLSQTFVNTVNGDFCVSRYCVMLSK